MFPYHDYKHPFCGESRFFDGFIPTFYYSNGYPSKTCDPGTDSIYRETRSQELVEALWAHPESPWHERINMLGETATQRGSSVPMATQAAWVRSLMASFVKEWVEGGSKVGGLFGAPRSADEPFLPWTRAMQAGFLITCGIMVKEEIEKSNSEWANHLRSLQELSLFGKKEDAAFYSKNSLLSTDQGIRGILLVFNDLCSISRIDLELDNWRWEDIENRSNGVAATDENAVSMSIKSLARQPAINFLRELSKGLASFDWRTSSTPGMEESMQKRQSIFRGSSGYKQMRLELLQHLENNYQSSPISAAAKLVRESI